MADISKRGGSDCDEGGERGKRGKRGKRGEPGPAGSTEAIVIDGSDPDTQLIGGEDGNAGAPFYVDPNTAFLAHTDTEQHARVMGLLGKSTLGPRGMTAGLPVPAWTAAGPLVLPTSAWDLVTGGSGGLISGEAYYVDATPGRLTTRRPTDDDAYWTKVGVAITATAMNVQIGVGPVVDDTVNPRPPPPLPLPELQFGAGLEVQAGSSFVIPYAPGDTIVSLAGPGADQWFIGFGRAVDSSAEDTMCWAAPFAATLTTLQVNVPFIDHASVDFSIWRSLACNQGWSNVLTIVGVTEAGCYSVTGEVAVNPGDRITFVASITQI
jgi:hypothetical protein